MYDDYSDYAANSGPPSSDEINSLTAGAANLTGTSSYNPDSGTGGDLGSVINSSANPITTNSGPVDASGGNGSIPAALQNIATQGLNDAIVSAQDFGIGQLTDLFRIGAAGNLQAAAAPSGTTAEATMSGIPWGWIVVGALGIFLVVHAVKHG